MESGQDRQLTGRTATWAGAAATAPICRRAFSFVLVVLAGVAGDWLTAAPAQSQLGGDAELCVARSGNPRLDIDTCSQAIRAGQVEGASLATVYQMRGRAFLEYGLYKLAVADYDAALALNPSAAEAFNGRGLARHHLGAYDGAIADFDEALRLYPHFVRAYRNRGVSHHFAGAPDLADADYAVARQMDPLDPAVHALRGLSRYHQADFAGAIADLTASLALQYPYDQGPLFVYLARTRAGQDGRTALAAAATFDPSVWPAPVFDLFLGRAGPAAVLSAAAEADPKHSEQRLREARYFLGQHALIQNRPADAVVLFQAVLDADLPASFEVVGARAELARLRP